MDFYTEKGRDAPRFIYRNLTDKLVNASASDRARLIEEFCDFISQLQPSGDWYKMKWTLPKKLASALQPAELEKVNLVLAARRKKRNQRLIEVYPHCSDEYSIDHEFLDAALGARKTPMLNAQTKIFTIGSCFARNIARYLESKNFNVSKFMQMEDLNSPFSNAKMLSICAAAPDLRKAYIEHWVNLLYPEDADHKTIIKKEIKRLDDLTALIKDSEFLVITCGNVIDYFLDHISSEFETGPKVAPKFLSISTSEDVTNRSRLTGKLKEAGAEFRIGSYFEVLESLKSLHASIRTINPNAQILITLSPIPIDSALGLVSPENTSSVEIDCISKSLLRAALHELIKTSADAKLTYFPSFEIVRWIAPNIDAAVFGKEDAASRHVSQDILNGIYEYFLYCFGDTISAIDNQDEPTELFVTTKTENKKPGLFRKLAGRK